MLGAADRAADGRAAAARRACADAGRGCRSSPSRARRRSRGCRAAPPIVAFSAEEVYAIAELIRRQRGGAAVVLGALSPRTRNAQVALYQSGDVDYLVATDAIGMGLNLDVDHVAFASDRKFDGYQFRKLNPAELGADRRPRRPRHPRRHLRHHRALPAVRDRAGAGAREPFSSSRSRSCNGATPRSISPRSARCRPRSPRRRRRHGLTRAPVAEDILVLEHAARDDDIRALATTRHGGRAACGRSARSPTIARSRPPPTPSSPPRSMAS